MIVNEESMPITISKKQERIFKREMEQSFHIRLKRYLEDAFDDTSGITPNIRMDKIVATAVKMGKHISAENESQLAKIALILIAIEQMEVPEQILEDVKKALTDIELLPDIRISKAARLLEIPG
jgi:hypothetical protein